jgi:hypothetical protein
MSETKQDTVEFEEPPPRRTQRYDWDAIAKQLRRKPMRWAKVFDKDKTSIATAIRIDGIKALRADKGFEVTTSNNDRGNPEEDIPRTCTMYLRYNPEKDRSK